MSRRDAPQLAFDAISIEGGLLPADWLGKVALLQATQQDAADYGIPRGLNLRDELGRNWRMAEAHWNDFAAARKQNHDAHAVTVRFITSLLRDVFGFTDLGVTSTAEIIDDRHYPVTAQALTGRLPLVVAAHDQRLEARDPRFGDSGRQRSAFGLLQDYLNAAEPALWGIVSNGLVLRLARDNSSLTRPAWIEADLERIFTEERYSDFSVLWLLIQASRFGKPDQLPQYSALESWRNACREAGVPARERLRGAVEESLRSLGQGFLSAPGNQVLRDRLADGSLTSSAYFQQLLRLVYRLIFLLTIEERGLLHAEGSDTDTVELYRGGYSLQRLRERSRRRRAFDRNKDLWDGLKPVFSGLANGQPLLALPALGGLFADEQCVDLNAAQLGNAELLTAMFNLGWMHSDGALVRINWRDMGPEEFGSVYEGLLELIPKVEQDGRKFHLAQAGGNERKTTGSYYTHDVLVEFLLDTALDPIIRQRLAPTNTAADAENALLSITVIDPACGSGHFLLAAARRLAQHLARVRADGTPSGEDFRHALRDVVAHCIYGVDRNPMALELARIALWLETMTPDRPLGFIDHHLACGDALLGLMNLDVLRHGIPNAAFKAVGDDDHEVCKKLVARNRPALKQLASAAGRQSTLDFSAQALREAMQALEQVPDLSLSQIAVKREQLNAIRDEVRSGPLALAADMYVAAFLAGKQQRTVDVTPTSTDLLHLMIGNGEVDADVSAFSNTVARHAGVLHWPLVFPHVFAQGGFDLVLGNPPWETMSPDIKEFFSAYIPDIGAMTPEQQEVAVSIQLNVPAVAETWRQHCRDLYGAVLLIKEGGRYTRFAEGNLGKGDFNVYRQFVELAMDGTRPGGYAAQIVPENFYNGANAAGIRKSLLESFDLKVLFGFENHRKIWFSAVDSRAKFSLYAAHKQGASARFQAAFSIRNPAELAMSRQHPLSVDVPLVREFSPDAVAVMEFSNQYEINICRKLYAIYPHFGNQVDGLPYRDYKPEVHMGGNNDLFTTDPGGLPVYQGSMVTHHDYRAKGYVSGHGRNVLWEELPFGDPSKAIRPQWYIVEDVVPDKCRTRVKEYRIGFCDVGNATNQRALMAALIPPNTICGHKVPTFALDGATAADYMLWLGAANSLVLDFLVRMKVALTMSMSLMDTLPFPRTVANDPAATCIAALATRLSCTGPEMTDFLKRVQGEGQLAGYDLSPAEDEETRRGLAAEINARVAKDLYNLLPEELAYILDPRNVLGNETTAETFRSLRDQEIRAFGEYRTQRLVMDEYTRLSNAEAPMRTYSEYGAIQNRDEELYAGFVLSLIREASLPLARAQLNRALFWLQSPQLVRQRLAASSATRMGELLGSLPGMVAVDMGVRVDEALRALESASCIRVESQGSAFRVGDSATIPSWVRVSPDVIELARIFNAALQAEEPVLSLDVINFTDEQRKA
ncbi:MAG: N-6 DNA methylase [Comamonas sp.]